MKQVLLVLFLLLTLASCDKIQKTEKTITGIWNLYEYKFTAPTGLVYYWTSEGTVDFGSCGDEVCNYSIHIDYQNDGGSFTKYENGKIHFSDETSFSLERINANGTTTILSYGKIQLVTKDDLQLEFSDEHGLHGFVLQK